MFPDDASHLPEADADWPAGTVPAVPWRRIVARLVDLLLIAALAALASVVAAALSGTLPDEPGAEVPLWMFYVSFLTGALYEVAFIARNGQTPGKRFLKVQVVSAPGGGVPPTSAAVIRWFIVAGVISLPSPPTVQLLLMVAVAVTCLVPMFTRPDRRGFHDRFAATAVIEAPTVAPADPWA